MSAYWQRIGYTLYKLSGTRGFSVGDGSGFQETYLIRPLEGTRNLCFKQGSQMNLGFD